MFNVVSYYVAKWIEEIIVAIPASFIFCGLMYVAVGLSGNFFFFWIIWLTTLVAGKAFIPPSPKPCCPLHATS